MRKTFLSFLIIVCSFIFFSDTLLSARLNNISQSGSGNNGIIKIEFNKNYDSVKDIKTNYLSDRVEIILPDSFVVPVKRSFRSSSEKSSVLKMDAVNIAGRSLKVSVYFRDIPIDTIKNTAELESKGAVLLFKYSTALDAVVEAEPKPIINEIQKTDIEEITKQESLIPVAKNKNGLIKYFFAMSSFIKMLVLIVILGLVMFLLFYFVRKNFKPKMIDDNVLNNYGEIKLISSLKIDKNKTLYVVEAMGESILISISGDNVTALSRLGSNTQPEQISLFSNEHTVSDIMKTRLKEKLGK